MALGTELYRIFFEAAGDALLAIDLRSGDVVAANPALEQMTQIQARALSDLAYTPSAGERERALTLELLRTPGYYGDIALPTQSGSPRIVIARVRHAKLGVRELALVVLSDDTERQLVLRDLTAKHQSMELAYVELERAHAELSITQEQMARAARLVALGELAAGMSHELNQPLTGISGFAQEILDTLKDSTSSKPDTLQNFAREIVKNADKMASLLSHMRSFARKESRSPGRSDEPLEAVSVREGIENVRMLLGRQLHNRGIAFEVRGLEQDISISGRAHPFEQVLINLISNARDAVAERLQKEKSTAGKILITLESSDKDCYLRVIDNGSGIPADVRAKIFDPFFTTKEPGKGLGLGLSISFNITHSFGGEITLESSSPSGTTFLLRLPRAVTLKKREAA